nr:hypothetical protein [Tanacetum cinerariifolium]
MNPTAASQIAFDNTLVPPEARLKIGNIETLPELFVDHMHQPWRTFAVVFNRCISEKTTRLDKLSLTQRTYQVAGKAKKDVTSTKMTATKPKPTKKKAPIKANRGKAIPDEQQHKISGTDERTGAKPGVFDVPKYDFKSNKESWVIVEKKMMMIMMVDHERTKSDKDENSNLNQSNEEPKEEEEEYVDKFIDKEDDTSNDKEDNEEELDDVEELYKDEEEDAHVALTVVHDTQKTEADNEIASLMDTTVHHEEPSSRNLLFIPHQEEALADRREYIDLIDTSVRAVIKKEVNSQLPHIRPQAVLEFATFVIERNITESLEVVVLAKSSSQPKFNYKVAASLSEFELTKIHIDKMKEHKSYLRANYKKELYDALVKSYNTEKDLFDTYGDVFTLKRSRDDKDKDQDPSARVDRGTKRRKSSKDVESSRDLKSKDSKSTSYSKDTSCSQHKSSRKSSHAEESKSYSCLTELEYHFEECFKAKTKQLDWDNPEGKQYPFDLRKPLLLILNHRGHHVIPFDYFVNNDLEYLKVTSLKIMKRYDYGHLDEIEVRREDQQLYKYKEGDIP